MHKRGFRNMFSLGNYCPCSFIFACDIKQNLRSYNPFCVNGSALLKIYLSVGCVFISIKAIFIYKAVGVVEMIEKYFKLSIAHVPYSCVSFSSVYVKDVIRKAVKHSCTQHSISILNIAL